MDSSVVCVQNVMINEGLKRILAPGAGAAVYLPFGLSCCISLFISSHLRVGNFTFIEISQENEVNDPHLTFNISYLPGSTLVLRMPSARTTSQEALLRRSVQHFYI